MRHDTGWFKSSYSNGGGDNCVEVRVMSTMIGLRDSKNAAGRECWVGAPAWSAFVTRTKAGEFDQG